jgi:transcriptional regulator with XRE-family HTH domain
MRRAMQESLELLCPATCRDARTLLGLSQSELASLAGVSTSTVKRFESGEREPNAYALKQIAAALDSAGVSFVRAGRRAEQE